MMSKINAPLLHPYLMIVSSLDHNFVVQSHVTFVRPFANSSCVKLSSLMAFFLTGPLKKKQFIKKKKFCKLFFLCGFFPLTWGKMARFSGTIRVTQDTEQDLRNYVLVEMERPAYLHPKIWEQRVDGKVEGILLFSRDGVCLFFDMTCPGFPEIQIRGVIDLETEQVQVFMLNQKLAKNHRWEGTFADKRLELFSSHPDHPCFCMLQSQKIDEQWMSKKRPRG